MNAVGKKLQLFEGDRLNLDIFLYKGDTLIKDGKNLDVENIDNAYRFYFDVLTEIEQLEDNLIFKRIDDDYEFTLHIKEEPLCNIYLKKEDVSFDINVDYARCNREENKLIIEYKIETDDEENKVIIVKH